MDGLVTYKYQVRGSGQVVADYESGVRSYRYQELAP